MSKEKMLAYHGQSDIKAFYVARVRAHQVADEIVQGLYWENGKGCAVGCTLHSSSGDHDRYESKLGIPRQLAYLQDRIFEGLENGEAKSFPLAFLEAIPVGADLSLVLPQFMIWLLGDEEDGVIRFVKSEQGKAANAAVTACYKRLLAGEKVSTEDWLKVRRLAVDADAAAAYAAAAADAAAVDAAAAAYAAYAAADAAAAYAAAAYAAYAAADAYADADARRAHFRKMRDKLLELLAYAPVAKERQEHV